MPVPYATIQSAVDAVQGTPDALVRIDSHGLFPEQVVISESVAITGGTVDGVLAAPSIVGGISFVPDGAGRETLRLERLYVIAPADADEGSVLIRVDATGSGVAALECTNCVLEDPSAVGPTGIVLDAEGSLDVDIHGSRIESSGRQPEGIVVNGGGRVVVRDSQIFIEGDGSGIRAASYAAPLELEILRDGISVDSGWRPNTSRSSANRIVSRCRSRAATASRARRTNAGARSTRCSMDEGCASDTTPRMASASRASSSFLGTRTPPRSWTHEGAL